MWLQSYWQFGSNSIDGELTFTHIKIYKLILNPKNPHFVRPINSLTYIHRDGNPVRANIRNKRQRPPVPHVNMKIQEPVVGRLAQQLRGAGGAITCGDACSLKPTDLITAADLLQSSWSPQRPLHDFLQLQPSSGHPQCPPQHSSLGILTKPKAASLPFILNAPLHCSAVALVVPPIS